MRTDPAARTIWGFVGSSGAIIDPGSADWTAARTGVGAYTVRFLRSFRAPPAVMLTAGGFAALTQTGATTGSFTVSAATPNTGVAADNSFQFEVIGRPL